VILSAFILKYFECRGKDRRGRLADVSAEVKLSEEGLAGAWEAAMGFQDL
jgi:hypothetical protein